MIRSRRFLRAWPPTALIAILTACGGPAEPGADLILTSAEVQPYHTIDDMRWMEERIGERARWAYAFRTLEDAWVLLSFGSGPVARRSRCSRGSVPACYSFGNVTPTCPWYFPFRSAYATSGASSPWKKTSWAIPSPP